MFNYNQINQIVASWTWAGPWEILVKRRRPVIGHPVQANSVLKVLKAQDTGWQVSKRNKSRKGVKKNEIKSILVSQVWMNRNERLGKTPCPITMNPTMQNETKQRSYLLPSINFQQSCALSQRRSSPAYDECMCLCARPAKQTKKIDGEHKYRIVKCGQHRNKEKLSNQIISKSSKKLTTRPT